MKKVIIVFMAILLCVSFLPIFAQAAPDKKDDKNMSISIKGEYVKKPPYAVYFEADDSFNVGGQNEIYYNLVISGKKDNIGDSTVTGGGWEFTVYGDFTVQFKRGAVEYGYVDFLQSSNSHQIVNGKASATFTKMDGKIEATDPFEKEQEKREKKEKLKEKLRKMVGKTKEQAEKELKDQLELKPKNTYKASFTIPAKGVYAPDCRDAIHGDPRIDNEHPGWQIAKKYTLVKTYVGNIDFKVDITIDDANFAKATVNYTTCDGNPVTRVIDGIFTCQQELETKLKGKKDVPVWGTWTDRDVYAPVPKILKDHEKRYAQLTARATDPSAKVDELKYNNGKWLELKKGKKLTYPPGGETPFDPKQEMNAYTMVEITDSYIIYETGEIWAEIGSLSCRPKERYKFPHDRQNNMGLYSKPLTEYKQELSPVRLKLTYNFYDDTLMSTGGFFIGSTLNRVKDVAACETWSSIEGAEKPDPKKVRDTAGTWYEFKLAKGEYIDTGKKDENGDKILEYVPSNIGGYTFEKITVNNDKTATVLSGRAEITAFDDTIRCYIEKTIIYDASGKETVTKHGYNKDGSEIEDYEFEKFNVTYSDYDKSAGTIKLNGKQFYKATKSSLNGSWSTHKDAPPAPDASKANARAAIFANYSEPVDWIKFDSSKREFIQVSWMGEGDGLLIEKGTYKTFGDNQIVLENITGTYYSAVNTLVFENEAWDTDTKTLIYYPDGANVIYVSGIGKMNKAK